MEGLESQNYKAERPVRRTGIIYMRKRDLFDALKEMFKKSRNLRQPKSGWGEFRDWIDKTRIILQHGFGVDSDQEREFMQIEYAPNVNGRTVLSGSPFQSVDSLIWYSEGITKAQACLASIMDEAVNLCTEQLASTSSIDSNQVNQGRKDTRRKLRVMVSSAVYGY